jgi:hypothetical protein
MSGWLHFKMAADSREVELCHRGEVYVSSVSAGTRGDETRPGGKGVAETGSRAGARVWGCCKPSVLPVR